LRGKERPARRSAKPAKAKVEAKRHVARKSRKNEGSKVDDLEKRLAEGLEREKATDRALTEAVEQQTATSEILRVIAGSPTDVQPVVAAVAASAARLCDAFDATIFQIDGDRLRVAVHDGPIASHPVGQGPSLVRETPSGRAVLDRLTIHIADMQAASDEYPEGSENARRLGHRTTLVVPLLHAGEAIGAIAVRRTEVRPFTDRQVELLKTFADQAVIAIENVRLFKELEARNRDLTESLDRQTATAEILRAISQAPADVQPVFEAIADSAMRLFGAWSASVFRYEDELIRIAAARGGLPGSSEAFMEQRQAPRFPMEDDLAGRAVLTRARQHIVDVATDPSGSPQFRKDARSRGWHSAVSVPMLRGADVVGVIAVTRDRPGGFAPAEIALLQTFADQAVIAVENARLLNELKAKNIDLTEALEQQTATSEILRVISSSPTDVQPVFDTIVANAVSLSGARMGAVYQFDGGLVHLVAHHNYPPVVLEALQRMHPRPPQPDQASGQAILTRAVAQIEDTLADPQYPREIVLTPDGFRSVLAVPMLRDGTPIGTIVIARGETGRFADGHVDLLKTFADLAVIAIENVRLFTELQEKNRALTEAHAQVTETLEQQTATSEILKVISESPTDVQPVFDAIATKALDLCRATTGWVYRFDGELIHIAAAHSLRPEAVDVVRESYPMPPSQGGGTARAVLSRTIVYIPDIREDHEYRLEALARAADYLSVLAVPMLLESKPIGVVVVTGAGAGAFSQRQIALLQTFADQAVIAIENVRLFTELDARNRELTMALDTQTATSDILRVISQSQTDVQPVFDAIVHSAVRLLRAYAGGLLRVAGEQIELAALTSTDDAGDAALRARYPQSLQSEGPQTQAIRDRAPLNIADAHTDPRLPEAMHTYARVRGFRSQVVVPMLRHGEAVGTISVARREPGGFTDDEIALLQTFADQAVIAIENARLLSELQARTQELTRSVEQLTALGDVGRAVSSSLDLDTVLTTIVGRAVQLSGTDGGTIFEYDESTEEFSPRATLNAHEGQSAMLRATRLRRGEGAVGQMAVTREPLQISDIATEGAYESRLRGALLGAGTRALLAIPLLHENRIVGGLVVSRRTPGEFTTEVVEILTTFATQSALAIQNARLFREIEVKGRELEAASRHKSEFLANMSHELRTPLNAIIGFSEVLSERMFGELNEKQEEYLKDIHASGQHLLSLINDILDLSKIEAGRMELELANFDLLQAIENALVLVRERALRRGITLEQSIDPRLGEIRGDERKVKQVLLNLLSNAIKFTPEGGRVEVRAGVADNMAELSVMDTGVGIAAEDQQAVFEEFRQVGAVEKKAEGTGLGLALARKFIELHGGRIWVESQVGAGSTFTFTLPVRHGE
jgi:GAF domain-containing protein